MSNIHDFKNWKRLNEQAASDTVDTITYEVLIALLGFTENEDAVYDQIGRLKSASEYAQLLQLFVDMKITKDLDWYDDTIQGYTPNEIVQQRKNLNVQNAMSFPELIRDLFNEEEISKVNAALPEGADPI